MKRSGKPPGRGPTRSPNPSEPHPLETLFSHVAGEPADPAEPGDEARGQAFARSLRTKVDAQLAQLRRQLTPDRAVKRALAVVPPDLQELSRLGLMDRLARLRSSPEVRFNNLEVSTLADDDLRQLIAELENVERSQS